MNMHSQELTASRVLHVAIMTVLVMVIAATSFARPEVSNRDGSTWRGSEGDAVTVTFVEQRIEQTLSGKLISAKDNYIVIEADIAGELREKVIFRADVVKVENTRKADTSADAAATGPKRDAPRRRGDTSDRADLPVDDMGREVGVFVLPLEGPVGETFRHQEILEIGKHADKFGPGQTIVLLVSSNGGLVLESLEINQAIQDVRKRHRVVAWLDKAISAGCSTAMACEEIYFMSTATAGSVTTLAGGRSLGGAEAELHVEDFVKLAKKSGYSEHIARAMKLNKYACSYDKDPVTGEVTFYGDQSGEFVLSTEDQNLSFNASNALHCGFSRGTADTEEELAKLLGMAEWNEIDDHGRKLAKKWQRTATEAKRQIAKLFRDSQRPVPGGDALANIGKRVRIIEELIDWVNRAELVAMMEGVPPKERLEDELEQLRKQMGDMIRARRNRR